MICSKCGFQNPSDGSFCASCGNQLQVYSTNIWLSQPSHSIPSRSGQSQDARVLFVALVLVSIIAVSSAVGLYTYYAPFAASQTSPQAPIKVTSLILVIDYPLGNSQDEYFGPIYRNLTTGPVYLQYGVSWVVQFTLFLRGNETSHIVGGISVHAYGNIFQLQSTTPSTLFSIAPSNSSIVSLVLTDTRTSYNGPVWIDLVTA